METITISKDFFEHLINCLANQKFICEMSKEDRKENQKVIDDAWTDALCLLNNKDFVPQSSVLKKEYLLRIAGTCC